MAEFFIDVEAFGGCPRLGTMTEFAAIEFQTEKIFHGVLWKAVPDELNPATSRLDTSAVQKSEPERRQVIVDFDNWLKQFPGPCIFWSDNNGYDWQWINDIFWVTLGYNPFGHSSRRISDFYAGLVNDRTKATKWKKLRKPIPHDHDPRNDTRGNLLAFKRILRGER